MLSFWSRVCCQLLSFNRHYYFTWRRVRGWVRTLLSVLDLEPLLSCRSCLLSPGSLQFLTSWTSDALTRDARTHLSYFWLLCWFSRECLLSLTDPPRLSQSYGNGKGKKMVGLTCILYVYYAPTIAYIVSKYVSASVWYVSCQTWAFSTHMFISGGLYFFVHVCICCSLSVIAWESGESAHAFNQAISGFARWLYTVPPPLFLPWSFPPLLCNILLQGKWLTGSTQW